MAVFFLDFSEICRLSGRLQRRWRFRCGVVAGLGPVVEDYFERDPALFGEVMGVTLLLPLELACLARSARCSEVSMSGTHAAKAPAQEICVIESLANWPCGEHALPDQVLRQVPIAKGTMDDNAGRGCRDGWTPRRAHHACLVDHELIRSYQIGKRHRRLRRRSKLRSAMGLRNKPTRQERRLSGGSNRYRFSSTGQ